MVANTPKQLWLRCLRGGYEDAPEECDTVAEDGTVLDRHAGEVVVLEGRPDLPVGLKRRPERRAQDSADLRPRPPL